MEYINKKDVLDILDDDHLLPETKRKWIDERLKVYAEDEIPLKAVYLTMKRYMEMLDLNIQQAWVYLEEAYKKEFENDTDKQE